jgi:hypothetical protein
MMGALPGGKLSEIQSPNRQSLIANRRSQVWEWVLLALILFVAGSLRLWRLNEIPPGFTHDEAGHGHDAAAILRGARPIYETVGYGREPLYDYWVAGLMALGGSPGRVLRFSSVPLGLMTLLATYAWVRLALGRPTALAATALQAASFWSLATAREALRSGLLPALFALAAYFYWRAVFGTQSVIHRKGAKDAKFRNVLASFASWRFRLLSFVLLAVFIGATLYTYFPARVAWTVFLAFLVYLAVWQRGTFRRTWLPVLATVAAGWLLAAPMFVWLQQHPGAEQRLAMLDAPLQALKQWDLSVILNRAWAGLCAFFVPGRGDDFLAYGIPGRPFFDPLTGALFLIGVGLCLAHWRQPACAFALIWFAVGISPTLITGAPAATTRSIAALPVAFLFPALAVVEGARWAAARWGRQAVRIVGVGFAGLVVATGIVSARDYFVRWGESPDVRAAYQHTLVAAAEYLGEQREGGTVAVSSVYPLAPHDPYVFEVSLVRRDLTLRWFDARRALLIPAETTARLVAPSSASLAPYFADLPGLQLRERVTMRPGDLDPFFAVYDWRPQETLAALAERVQSRPSDPALPVDFGPSTGSGQDGTLQLIGYDLRTPVVVPGGIVELLTLWRVAGAPPRELVLFTHALDAGGDIAGQEDRLDAPSWDWQPGDVVAQLHRFTLPTDLLPGTLALEVGVYTRADLVRLPVLVNGVATSDRVLLSPVEVIGQ